MSLTFIRTMRGERPRSGRFDLPQHNHPRLDGEDVVAGFITVHARTERSLPAIGQEVLEPLLLALFTRSAVTTPAGLCGGWVH